MAKYFDRGSPLNRSNQGQDPVRRVNRNRSLNTEYFRSKSSSATVVCKLIPQGHPQKKHKPFAERYGASPTPTQTVTVSTTTGGSPTNRYKYTNSYTKPYCYTFKNTYTDVYSISNTNTYTNNKHKHLLKQELKLTYNSYTNSLQTYETPTQTATQTQTQTVNENTYRNRTQTVTKSITQTLNENRTYRTQTQTPTQTRTPTQTKTVKHKHLHNLDTNTQNTNTYTNS